MGILNKKASPEGTVSDNSAGEAKAVETNEDTSIHNPLTEAEAEKFDAEPILQKNTNTCGWVELFSPSAPSSEWKNLPWLMKCERDGAGKPYADNEEFKPAAYELSGAHVHEAFERPYFIPNNLHWHYIGAPLETAAPALAGVGSAASNPTVSPDLSGESKNVTSLDRFRRLKPNE